MAVPFPIPPNLALAAGGDDGPTTGWLAQLPAAVAALERRWEVRCGEPFSPGGQTAWVAPATGRDGQPLVVKLAWPHPEAAHEADGLQIWNGSGAVRLHAQAGLEAGTGLLLERCLPGDQLSGRPEPEQDVVIAGILQRLWVDPPPGASIPPLAEMCSLWAADYYRKSASRPGAVDQGLAREALRVFTSLPASSPRSCLLFTDLHAANVLSAAREPWLAVDPKPYRGDPTYDAVQHLLNCEERLMADPMGMVRRLAQLLSLDAERLRLWVFARCVIDALDEPALLEVAGHLAP